MAPRSMWKGSLTIGLLNLPIKMYKSADDRGGVELHQYHIGCGQRIQMPKSCPEHGALDGTQIEKGFIYGADEHGDHVVTLTDADMESIALPSVRAMQIEQFVPLDVVPFPTETYYLAPDPLGAHAFDLLRDSMVSEDVQAVVKVTIRNRERLAFIAPHGNIFTMTTAYWPEEVRDPSELGIPSSAPTDAERAMASQLIKSMTSELDPSRYKDDYQAAMKSLIADKISGVTREVTPTPMAPPPDLTALLKASMEAQREPRGK